MPWVSITAVPALQAPAVEAQPKITVTPGTRTRLADTAEFVVGVPDTWLTPYWPTTVVVAASRAVIVPVTIEGSVVRSV